LRHVSVDRDRIGTAMVVIQLTQAEDSCMESRAAGRFRGDGRVDVEHVLAGSLDMGPDRNGGCGEVSLWL